MQAVIMAIGFFMLIKGADWFVDGASGIASKLGIPQLVIGLTIVAMGTSAPETAVSLSSALKGNAGICIGNVIGSNILNVLVILGVSALLVNLKVAASTVRYEIPYMIFITIVLLLFGYTDSEISLFEGAVLWVLFIVYLAYLFVMAKKNKVSDDTVHKNISIWRLILYVVLGLVLIVWGSDVTVDSATAIAEMIGISDRFIGLTIVALGTSLPELVTSVTAAKRGNADIAIGNIVGSNIFNILFVIGTTAFITPVVFAQNFLVDTVIAVFTGLILWVGIFKKRMMGRKLGAIMLLGYAVYFVWLL